MNWTTTHGDWVQVYPATLHTPVADQHRGSYLWRYRVIARNGRIVEQGSESYTRRRAAVKAAERHHPRVAVQP